MQTQAQRNAAQQNPAQRGKAVTVDGPGVQLALTGGLADNVANYQQPEPVRMPDLRAGAPTQNPQRGNSGQIVLSGGSRNLNEQVIKPEEPFTGQPEWNRKWKSEFPALSTRNRQRNMLEMSTDSYPEGGHRPAGMEEMSPEQIDALGVNPSLFNDMDSGFASKLYKDKQTGEYVLAFRGTEPNWKERNDIINDLEQGVGWESEQYKKAIALARTLDAQLKQSGARLTFTGHSLGGGLATASSAATGRRAVVFNPAAVHPNTLSREGVVYNKNNTDRLVTSMFVPGELLSVLQTATPVVNAAGLGGIPFISKGLQGADIQGHRVELDTHLNPWNPLNIGTKHLTGALHDSVQE